MVYFSNPKPTRSKSSATIFKDLTRIPPTSSNSPPHPSIKSFSKIGSAKRSASRSDLVSRKVSLHDASTTPLNSIYTKMDKLGEGSYAIVYKSYDRLNNRIVALKEIQLQQLEGLPFTAIREASLLRELSHANIVHLYQIIHQADFLILAFEYMATDLSKYLEFYKRGLDIDMVRLFMFQLLRGLAFCHQRRILHRDLKPQNLLIDDSGELKLADFGLARAKSVPSRTFSNEVVTLWYRPPDVLLGSTNYSSSLDMWGVGCIMAEMTMGRPLFPGVSGTTDQLEKIFQIRGSITDSNYPEAVNLPDFHKHPKKFHTVKEWNEVSREYPKILDGILLLNHLLQLNPDLRMSAQSAMTHSFFSSFPATIHFLPPNVSILTVISNKQIKKLYSPKGKVPFDGHTKKKNDHPPKVSVKSPKKKRLIWKEKLELTSSEQLKLDMDRDTSLIQAGARVMVKWYNRIYPAHVFTNNTAPQILKIIFTEGVQKVLGRPYSEIYRLRNLKWA
uniref:Protein kinase domain-containing protein n=1 Tax=Rhabditophanes sp. KR3021 TaxID=114890 RepID=A0AC35TZM9_9BILA